jgi:hypothetical protein
MVRHTQPTIPALATFVLSPIQSNAHFKSNLRAFSVSDLPPFDRPYHPGTQGCSIWCGKFLCLSTVELKSIETASVGICFYRAVRIFVEPWLFTLMKISILQIPAPRCHRCLYLVTHFNCQLHEHLSELSRSRLRDISFCHIGSAVRHRMKNIIPPFCPSVCTKTPDDSTKVRDPGTDESKNSRGSIRALLGSKN